MLLKELCRLYQVEEPPNLDSLRIGISQQFCLLQDKQEKMNRIEDDDDDDDEEDDLEEDIPLAADENDSSKNKVFIFVIDINYLLAANKTITY